MWERPRQPNDGLYSQLGVESFCHKLLCVKRLRAVKLTTGFVGHRLDILKIEFLAPRRPLRKVVQEAAPVPELLETAHAKGVIHKVAQLAFDAMHFEEVLWEVTIGKEATTVWTWAVASCWDCNLECAMELMFMFDGLAVQMCEIILDNTMPEKGMRVSGWAYR